MVIFDKGSFDSIVKHLGPHGPDALLGFVIFAGVLAAIAGGVDQNLAVGFGVTIYVIYCWRKWTSEKHSERLAELEVEKSQLANQRYREKVRSKLQREKLKTLPAPAPDTRAKQR